MATAALVHLSGGYIEVHFHFFVIVALVTLYQQWTPFLVMIGFVLVHHGVAAAIDPASVYNHPLAIAHPWSWAAIHAGFIAMASASGIANWKFNEISRHRAEAYVKRLYDGERALVRRLEEADVVKSELVAGVSHELRTPLTAIIGFSHMLRSQTGLAPDQVADVTDRLYFQSMRLRRVIENVLHADAVLTVDGEDRCDLELALAAVAALARERVDPPEIHVEVAAGVAWAMSDASGRAVLSNLIDNAAKFGTPGAPISVRVEAAEDVVTVAIQNFGDGVPSEMRDAIFDPYVQGDSSNTRSTDGLGLGLHVVRRIARASRGDVELVSGDGSTTFVVRVPRAVTEDRSGVPA